MPDLTLTLAQEHDAYLASSLAVGAGSDLLRSTETGTVEVAPIADRLFRALALLGRAFPDDPCWADPDRRAADPVARPGVPHA